MFDIKLIREDPRRVSQGLKAKNVSLSLDDVLSLYKQRRALQSQADDLRSQQNTANDEISKLLKEKKDTKERISAVKAISAKIDKLAPEMKALEQKMDEILIGIPNLPHESVPVGGPDKNKVVRSWGTPVKLDFKPKTHIEIAEALDIIDFKRATKRSEERRVGKECR